MNKFAMRGMQVAVDFAVLSLAYWLAFYFRFEFEPRFEMVKLLFFTWPYVVLLQYLVLVSFGVPRFAWRYIGIREATRILWAVTLSVGILVALRLVLGPFAGYAKFVRIPLGVLAMDFVMAFLGVVGARVIRRIFSERGERSRRQRSDRPRVRTLLIGAGRAGVMVIREIAARPDLGIEAVAFLDDDPVKVGTVVHGVPVLGPTSDIAEVAADLEATEALIAIANASGEDIRRLTMVCREAGLETKIIPGIYEIVGGKVNLSRIREVAIEDLLGREPVDLDLSSISAVIEGRVVMVTGAGGSIGSELCRQVARFAPSRLLLVEQAENALFNIHRELIAESAVEVVPIIADVIDAARMKRVFEEHSPGLVFHAAAHKHVPMMEWNPGEAVKNNLGGTRCVADLADAYGVGTFVLVSTDKAVNPTSVMGATKRAAELYVQCLARRSSTHFVAVRFGNVLGSAGSVIPIFKEQIAAGGPVTVTHPEMMRYFMTIPEACQLILQAGAMGEGGEIFILDMGEPVKIVDVARDLITLSGLTPGEDIEIAFTGMRPGEKLFEELSVDEEQAEKTRHPKIFIGRTRERTWDDLGARLAELIAVAIEKEGEGVREGLKRLIPEYVVPPSEAEDVPKPEAAAEAT
ncbi:MAG: nucleoside-diphosphate sugar epimerase/dehydratase [Deltaproteobacteria bacterium]|nr:nucleoside-diphosphate sugar epimerase/dehydratase [Deltaproteobacteria bacterium]